MVLHLFLTDCIHMFHCEGRECGAGCRLKRSEEAVRDSPLALTPTMVIRSIRLKPKYKIEHISSSTTRHLELYDPPLLRNGSSQELSFPQLLLFRMQTQAESLEAVRDRDGLIR
jgi:hypothetical protein